MLKASNTRVFYVLKICIETYIRMLKVQGAFENQNSKVSSFMAKTLLIPERTAFFNL